MTRPVQPALPARGLGAVAVIVVLVALAAMAAAVLRLSQQAQSTSTQDLMGVRASAAGSATRRRVAWPWRSSSIRPAATIRLESGAPAHVEVARYVDAKGVPVLYGLLNTTLPGFKEQRAEIVLEDAPRGVLYDVAAGKELGCAPQFSTVLRPGEARLLAVLPKEVKPGRASAVKARRGETAAVDFAFTGLSIAQAVRCEVTDATGRARPEYGAVIVAAGGRGQLRIPLAVNDPPGAWTVRLTHVLTGLQVTRSLVAE